MGCTLAVYGRQAYPFLDSFLFLRSFYFQRVIPYFPVLYGFRVISCGLKTRGISFVRDMSHFSSVLRSPFSGYRAPRPSAYMFVCMCVSAVANPTYGSGDTARLPLPSPPLELSYRPRPSALPSPAPPLSSPAGSDPEGRRSRPVVSLPAVAAAAAVVLTEAAAYYRQTPERSGCNGPGDPQLGRTL